jgi:hypothetical protein
LENRVLAEEDAYDGRGNRGLRRLHNEELYDLYSSTRYSANQITNKKIGATHSTLKSVPTLPRE